MEIHDDTRKIFLTGEKKEKVIGNIQEREREWERERIRNIGAFRRKEREIKPTVERRSWR